MEVVERVKQVASHLTGQTEFYPLDPLTEPEIAKAVSIIKKEHSDLHFNAVTLWEPRKKDMQAWLADPKHNTRPHRVADVVCIGRGSKVYDGLVDLDEGKILQWELTEGVQPLIAMEDLQIVEIVVRKDPKVIEQCGLLGIPPEDMHKVYCDREWNIDLIFTFSNLTDSVDHRLRRALR
jgi:primary-amine oxidase